MLSSAFLTDQPFYQAVYRSLLHLSWVDKLVDNLKTIFVDLYADELKKPNTTLVHCHKFDEYFDQQMRQLESSATSKNGQSVLAGLTSEDEGLSSNVGDEPPLPPGIKHRTRAQEAAQQVATTVDSSPAVTPTNSRPSTPGTGHLVVGKSGPLGKMSRRAKKMQNNSAPASSGDEAPTRKAKKAPKKGRKWNADGYASEEDDVQLDYSATTNGPTSESEAEGRSSAIEGIDSSTWGTKTSKGQFVLKDLDDEVNEILASAQSKSGTQSGSGGLVGAGFSSITGLFRNVVGGKTLTKEDLKKPMDGMKDHLIKKNVAPEAAVRLRDSVEHELLGLKTGSFESIDARIAKAMEASLTKMLTPTSSLDLLREVDAVTRPSALSGTKARPYVISVVGVNGVGKSTNLSKICFFLLENKYKVLVVAGDTFRSGAVEQLKVHVRNLKELTKREGGQVELFEKGYGGDAATVARDAVRTAANEGFDVVLVDTAGRRHNDQRLMSNLEKFAKFANPDKILMVGEVSLPPMIISGAKFTNMSYRHSLETTLLRKHKISMHPLVKAGVLTDSSYPSVIPWETWLALLSASSMRPTCQSCLSVLVSTMKISGAFQSNGLSRNSSVIANLLTMLL